MAQTTGSSTRDFFNIIYRRVWIMRFLVLALPVAVLAACLVVNPIYECTARVMLTGKMESTSLLRGPQEMGAGQYLNLNVDETDINSEMGLLTSLDLWMEAVKALGVNYFPEEKPGILGGLIESLKGSVQETVGTDGKKAAAMSPEELRSRRVAGGLLKKFKVIPAPKSKVLDVSFRDSSSERAQKILSTVLDLYIPYHMEIYSVQGAQKFFAGVGSKFWEDMQKADKNLAEFKKKWSISFPEKQKSELIEQIKQLQDGLVDLDSNITQYKNMIAALEKGVVPTGNLTPSMGKSSENTVINVISTQLLRAHQKKQQTLEYYSPDSRDVRVADEALTDLMTKLKEALKGEVNQQISRQKTVEDSGKAKQQQLQELEEKSEEARRLQLAATVAKERYLQYTGKEEEARLENLKTGDKLVNVKMLEKPFTPSSPIFPKTTLFVIGSFFLAFPLGVVIVLISNFFDHTFMTPREVEVATGFPVLASFKKVSKAA